MRLFDAIIVTLIARYRLAHAVFAGAALAGAALADAASDDGLHYLDVYGHFLFVGLLMKLHHFSLIAKVLGCLARVRRNIGLAALITPVVAVSIAGLPSVSAAQTSPAIQVARGPYAVGFRVVAQLDYGRVFHPAFDPVTGAAYQGERARPLQTLIWYPAQVSPSATRVQYQDYVRTRFTEANLAATSQEIAAAFAKYEQNLQRRLGPAAQNLLRSGTGAQFNASAVAGRFPVVIYAAGAGGSADENAELFEYLASHGMVVISSTSLAENGKEIGDGMEAAEPQIADVRFLLGYAHSLDFVDAKKIAVMGWSWGGMTTVFAAARDSRIGAIVSLDGTREPELTKQIDVRRLTAPWLYISRSPDTISQINRSGIDTSFSLLNAAKYTDVYQLISYPMQHHDFTAMRLHESSPASYREYQREELVQAYSVMAHYIRQFLAASLLKDRAAQDFLQKNPSENGAARHSMRMDISRAQAQVVTQSSFAQELAEDGFGKVAERYQAAQTRDPQFSLSAPQLQTWAYTLLAQKKFDQAVAIFSLWTQLYPKDANAFDSLAEGYEAQGKTKLAIDHYRRSLTLNPANRNAENRLKALGGSTSAPIK
ncbi:dienelactone hydrolase family protein [Undibacterium cyanobacteriorum]|uniref:Dienelactone hydrolase family protein n=1 Tax=Undibacterium cyanobacteriorum TaxID=3073561 RepID=A0ABY9RHZ3_9BURK|nr:dienelactone hydrolase family protein [Undibacterium sp. 20NA77.5]WMW80807.1 dienelactone hydrolase family protein [Undibacterium sp. 20NA77.5]